MALLAEDAISVLSSPIWQGVGAIAAIVIAIAPVLWQLARRKRARTATERPQKRIYNPARPQELEAFYSKLIAEIDQAKETIFRTGRGFTRSASITQARTLIEAEDAALARGVRIERMQTSPRAIKEWSDGLADLKKRFAESLQVYADFDSTNLMDVGLIDPYGPDPIIYIFFEISEKATGATHTGGGIYLSGPEYRAQAAFLAEKFVERSRTLPTLSSSDIRELSEKCFYFAYGPNMWHTRLSASVPSAWGLGKASAPGWSRCFVTDAQHAATVAGIQPAENEVVDGVLYQLPALARVHLNDLEQDIHELAKIPVDFGHQRVTAFTHLPRPTSVVVRDGRPSPEHLEAMIRGASETGLSKLVRWLKQLPGRQDPN